MPYKLCPFVWKCKYPMCCHQTMINMSKSVMFAILQDSPMRVPAEQFLTLRAFGAPPIVVALAAQGTFRGFKDTKTPLYAVGKYCSMNFCSIVIYKVINRIYVGHVHVIIYWIYINCEPLLILHSS